MVSKFSKHLLQFQDALISLDQSGKEQLIENLQSSLLMSLPHTISRLLTSLDADTVSFESLPKNLKDRWVSADDILRIQVMPAAGIISSQELREFSSQVRDVAPEATGDLVVTQAAGDTVVRAFKQAILFALIAITVLLLVYLRNIRDTMFILLPLILAGAFTGALTVVLNIDFNFANIIALPLLLGLGVDNGVHIVHRAKTDKSGRSLLQTSTARAILFSSLTTLFSFGNLAFSPHRGTASMGLLLTFGVVFVLLATLVILPAFLPKKLG
jgi:predicted RND superfamily exporter protein